MGMAVASGTTATPLATLAAGLTTGTAARIPVAPMAAVATGMEVNMRSRQNELARIWRTLDPGEQARAWKKEMQMQTEEDKDCQRKSDKEWEQRAEGMYASRECATHGIQDQLYSRKQFSAAKVTMHIKTDGKCVEDSTVADTGAATEIVAECRLDAETMGACKI